MHKLRNRVGLLVILAIISIGFIPNEVKASQLATSDKSAANSACNSALFNGDMLKATKDSTNGYISVNAINGIWNIKWYIGNTDDLDYSKIFGVTPISPSGSTVYKGGVDNVTITVPRLEEPQKVIVIAEAKGNASNHVFDNAGNELKVSYINSKNKQSTTTCKAGVISLDKSNKITITGTGAYISKTIPAMSSKELKKIKDDSEEGRECYAMRNGKYNTDLKDSSHDLTGADLTAYNQQMQTSFPYCYGTSYSSSFDYNAKSIKRIRQSSMKAYKEYLEFKNAQANNDKYNEALNEINNERFKEISYDKKTNTTTIDNLFCSKKATGDTTEKYYTRTTEADSRVCKVTCQEQIQITYGPPEAISAGLCFQYKVTVKSKVTCMAEKKADIVWPTPPNACGYTPICEGNANETQAGPSEEFDACINECDGGKYSQSCINKCYNKVYKKKSNNKINTTTLDTNVNKVKKLENKTSSDPYYADSKCNTNIAIKTNESYCAEYFYKLKQKYPMGYYIEAPANSASWIEYYWQPCFSNNDSKCKYIDENDKIINYSIKGTTLNPYSSEELYVEAIKRSSPYYFRNNAIALRTIQSFYAKNSGYNGAGDARYYVIDDGGIKRQRTSSYKCYETCGYIKDSNSGEDCKNNSQEVADDMVKKFEEIRAELSSCTSKAVCKEDTATFDMSVDNTAMKDKDTKDKSKWKATNKTNNDSKTCYNPDGYIKMFIPLDTDLETGSKNSECSINPNGINGKCYGKDNVTYWQHYKTTITFPGTWIDLKTAKRIYQKEEYDENTMRENENYYCVGYDYDSVNEQWWDWKTNGIGNIDNITVEQNDNIQATIKGFGKYNWGVRVNCFYALSNMVSPTDPECKGEECDTRITNVKLRPVDQSDLFAGRTGDKIGFNWTSDAQDFVAAKASNENAKSYGINPGEYAETIQKEAKSNPDSIYSGEVDYSLHLTRDNIKKLREYVKENKGYTAYKGNGNEKIYTEVPGIELYYYTSGILENDLYTTNFKRSTPLGKNND